MKFFWFKIMVGCLCLGLISSAAAEAFMRSIRYDGVTLYSRLPTTEAKLLFDFPVKHPVNVIKVYGKWAKVIDYMNLKGWVLRNQLSKERTIIVSSPKVNFRAGPGTGYRKVGKLYKGQVLKYIKKYGYWFKVKVIDPPHGPTGWIHRKLVWGW